MPEGPSIVLLKEEVLQFTGKKIVSIGGNSKIEQSRLLNQKIVSFKSWGKHFLIALPKNEILFIANRPAYSVMTSERAVLLPRLDDAMQRFYNESRALNLLSKTA